MKIKSFLALLGLAAFIISCAPAPETATVETIVAQTLQALTAAPPVHSAETLPANTPSFTAINGIAISFSKISFMIPIGIGANAIEEKTEAVAPSEEMPFWEVRPASVEYLLTNYALANTFHKPKIYVYPIAEYIAMNDVVAEYVETLKSLAVNPSQPLPEHLPFLPTFNAGQIFHSNFATLNFVNGSGIRYLTEFSQFPHPIYNDELMYTFQGITADEQYYVSAILPVNANLLVGYPTPTDQGDFTFIQNEVERVTQQLNSAAPDSFTPSLMVLDAMMQSLWVAGIP